MLEADIAARVDHRTLESQEIDREPRPQIPRAAFEMERHGYRSVVAERIRDEHQARVQVRLDKAAEEAKSAVPEPTIGVSAARPQSAEDVQREARENWLRYRQSLGQDGTESVADSKRARTRDRGHDDGLGC
jgi:hypothetical protein